MSSLPPASTAIGAILVIAPYQLWQHIRYGTSVMAPAWTAVGAILVIATYAPITDMLLRLGYDRYVPITDTLPRLGNQAPVRRRRRRLRSRPV